MLCTKGGKPKNTIVGMSYFGHEDEFPIKMKEIIAKNYPFTTQSKDNETSNDLLVKWIL